MKTNWKSEAMAAMAAISLAGVAMWGSLIPIDATPALHGNDRITPAVVINGVSMTFAMREGYNA